jgi:hypothetical protein
MTEPTINPAVLLAQLQRRGLSVRLDEHGRLKAGPKALLTDRDRADLAAHKDALVRLLGKQEEDARFVEGTGLTAVEFPPPREYRDAAGNPCGKDDAKEVRWQGSRKWWPVWQEYRKKYKYP